MCVDKSEVLINNHEKKFIIWGAGLWGRCALYYYGIDNVACFVDSNQDKWGTIIDGVEVCPPSVLKDTLCNVIIANKYDAKKLTKDAEVLFGIREVIVFEIKNSRTYRNKKTDTIWNGLSIRLAGGLGNQMFQYALYAALRSKGKSVYIRNNNISELELSKVFHKIYFTEISKLEEDEIVLYNTSNDNINSIFAIYRENMSYGTVKKADPFIEKIDCGIINGLFQTRYYADLVAEQLHEEFSFPEDNCKLLNHYAEQINNCDSVSIHIRLGDYLAENNKYIYGGICTGDYYSKAIDYIKRRVRSPIFFVFSNDVEKSKKILIEDNVIFVDDKEFDKYYDWYDMYLMSQCKHNIIANSTFSWWGAWLNRNINKIVIAPPKWVNTFEYEDIYPEDWIVIDS